MPTSPVPQVLNLDRLLIEALRGLERSGQTDEACTLAARACMQLRSTDPDRYRRFDALLHQFTHAYK